MDKIILDTYKEHGFPGPTVLQKILRRTGHHYTLNEIKQAIGKNETYQLHKSVKSNIQSSVVAFNTNDLWEMDLLDMQKYSHKNNGMKWILIVIDVFTRKAYGIALKTKGEKDVSDALKEIIKKNGAPLRIISDNGSEFLNKSMKKIYKVGKYFMKQMK